MTVIFTDEMIHPRNEIDKVYVARVKGLANKENLRPLTRGVTIDGKKTKPATYEILKVDPEKNRSVVQKRLDFQIGSETIYPPKGQQLQTSS